MSLGRRLLEGWTAIASHFGEVQTLVILAIFYTLVVGPAALGVHAARADLLAKRQLRDSGSAWRDADTGGSDIERAKLAS